MSEEKSQDTKAQASVAKEITSEDKFQLLTKEHLNSKIGYNLQKNVPEDTVQTTIAEEIAAGAPVTEKKSPETESRSN